MTKPKPASLKGKLNDENVAIDNVFAMEVERRQPEPYDPALAAKAGGQLDGLLVHIDRSDDNDIHMAAGAVLMIRRIMNKHGCTRKKESDPPCEHPNHWEDVAAMRFALMVTGLPGDLSLLPLAYAEE